MSSIQAEAEDTGLVCLLMMASLHGIAVDERKLKHQFGDESFNVQTLLSAAQFLGMTAKLIRQDVERLERAPLRPSRSI